jgi:hypothetical protein
MPRLRFLLPAAVLLGCHPTQLAQSCPSPSTAPASLLVTQVLLRRSPDTAPAPPDFTLSLTASGDALYVGSRSVPVSGEFMGRLGPSSFQRVVTDLIGRGLMMDGEQKGASSCAPQAVISIAVQTADGRYRGVSFCGRSEQESRLAGPIYSAIEQIRWYPGARVLALDPAQQAVVR